MQTRYHYGSLDGLRGIVAIVVMYMHGWCLFGSVLVPRGFLGVDFFYLLSGFVLAHSYQERLRGGMGLRAFAWARIARLYPMIFLGTALGTIALVATVNIAWPELSAAVILQLLLLPAKFVANGRENIWRIDPPTWSLFFETLANIAFAVSLARRGNGTWIRIAIVSFVCLCIVIVSTSTLEVGYSSCDILAGAPRTLLPFSMGVLIWRIKQAGRLPQILPGVHLGAVALALAVCFAIPGKSGVVDLLIVTLAFPVVLIVALTARYSSPNWARIGRLSYPLYMTHYPLLIMASAVQPVGLDLGARLLWLVAFAIVSLMVGWIATVAFDEPVRHWLRVRRTQRTDLAPAH